MTTLNLKLKFIEPYRVVQWYSRTRRNSIPFLRGYAFARWHCLKNGKNGIMKGRPYITGTLVRSAIIRAAEELLWLNCGTMENIAPCCQGEFEGNTAWVVKPKDDNANEKEHLKRLRYRRRSTLTWPDPGNCNEHDPCPFCLLLGRYEKSRRQNRDDARENQVNFQNFNVSDHAPVRLEDVADTRIVNRVDQYTGKARDFFKIWEIHQEDLYEYHGKIRLKGKAADNGSLERLIRNAAAFTDKIAGGLCYLTVDSEPVNEIEVERSPCRDMAHTSKKPYDAKKDAPYYMALKKSAKLIADAFEKNGKLVHLRLFSDVVRELRRCDEATIENLPQGHCDRLGKPDEHYIWDIRIEGETGKKKTQLRKWLPDKLKAIQKEHADKKSGYERVCEDLGQELFARAKEIAPDQFPSVRPLGTSQALKVAEPSKLSIKSSHDGPCCEYLIRGHLIARTPFYFGSASQADGDGEHTSLRLLKTCDGRPRLARSSLRGILRRDLQMVLGTGCRAELAAKTICACPVCHLMGKITIKDSRSENYTQPPQIRHRIRINPYKGIVDKGALFDMEIGPPGVRFPFQLRVRTATDTLPKELQTVLTWWSKGKAFLSGEAGTGKGRFKLDNIQVFCWNLKDQFKDYKQTCGGRKDKEPPNGNPIDIKFESQKDFPWQSLPDVRFDVHTPFITKDPIASLIAGLIGSTDKKENVIESSDDTATGIDAVCYKAVVVNPDGEEEKKYLLKGESLRGILRTAVGRRCLDKKNSVPLLEMEHEECTCMLCRLFGNEHEAGRVRVEDMEIKGDPEKCRIDRVAIDRFTGGARDQYKFDLEALVGTPASPLQFGGKIWTHKDLSEKECAVLKTAVQDVRDGLYPLGGLGNAGFGWLNYLKSDGSILSNAKKPIKLELIKDFEFQLFKKTYWPHYFLPFGPNVKRVNTPPPHSHFDPQRHTGKLVCRLTIKTPVIIPDAKTTTADNKHKTHRFFNLNGQLCIPGSEIKGMVSSVFEALTNSCLRMFHEKKRLSWRMKAEKLDQWKPGMIREEQNRLWVEEMEEMRLPVYDNHELHNDIKEMGKQGYYRDKQPTRTDNLINKYSEKIRERLNSDTLLLTGQKELPCFKCAPHGMDNIALLESPVKGCNRYKSRWMPRGYVHFTGPNKIEVNKPAKIDTPGGNAQLENNPLKIRHNKVFLDNLTVNSSKLGSVLRKRAIPKYEVISDGFVYTMTKRCERIFIPLQKPANYPVSTAVAGKYTQLCEEYKQNSDTIPEVFRTRLPKNGKLNQGALIYFLQKNAKVTDIIPVRISRIIDDDVLAQKLRDDLRPCVRELLDEDKARTIKSAGVKELFEQHPNGLCPACALFGTTYYKGRVAFGFAFSVDGTPELFSDDGLQPDEEGHLTRINLPLLERPRPTWSMPTKKSKVPGRKFYVHHQGWKEVIENSPNETPNENNKTVQALDKGQSLEFEVRFENLSDAELGLLIYALQLEPELAHKLGMGKALGFGSVGIEVKAIQPLANTKIPDANQIETAARRKLMAIWEVKTDAALAKKLDRFFKLMIYVASPEVRVRYPKLRKEDDEKENKAGYMELKDKAFKPETRTADMTHPWKSWA